MNAEILLNHFDRLSEAPDAIPSLRRFILDLAVRGKLVEQDPNDEPAEELIKRIQAEKQKLGLTPRRKAAKNSEKFGDLADGCEMPFAIPTGWEWLKLGELCIKTGSGSTPNGGQTAYAVAGIPFLRSQNIYDDGLRLDGVAYIPEVIHQRMIGTAVCNTFAKNHAAFA